MDLDRLRSLFHHGDDLVLAMCTTGQALVKAVTIRDVRALVAASS